MNPQLGEFRGEFRRVNRPRFQRPAFVRGPNRFLVQIRHHHPVDRLGRVARPPADDVRGHVFLAEDIPDGFCLSRKVRDRAHPDPTRHGLGEAENAVLVRSLAGRDCRPQHRREDRRQGQQIRHHAAFHESLRRRHQAGID